MSSRPKGRLVLLCGPSCMGKSPLEKSLRKFYPQLDKSLKPLVAYTSRIPRPGEKDGSHYFFRDEEHIEQLRKDKNFVVLKARGNLQAVDITRLLEDLRQSDIFFEGNTLMGRALQLHESLEEISKLSVFLSPLSQEEIMSLSQKEIRINLKELISEIMERKLLRREQKIHGNSLNIDIENIKLRANEAYDEIKQAHFFDWIIPNHNGEDSENWDSFYIPLGDARKALQALVDILENKQSNLAEKWGADLFA